MRKIKIKCDWAPHVIIIIIIIIIIIVIIIIIIIIIIFIISGAPQQRKLGHLSIREILVITWPYIRPSAPQGNQCEISHFLANCGNLQPDIAHPVVVNWQLQNKASADQSHMSLSRA